LLVVGVLCAILLYFFQHNSSFCVCACTRPQQKSFLASIAWHASLGSHQGQAADALACAVRLQHKAKVGGGSSAGFAWLTLLGSLCLACFAWLDLLGLICPSCFAWLALLGLLYLACFAQLALLDSCWVQAADVSARAAHPRQ
jgi:hypothetical protein